MRHDVDRLPVNALSMARSANELGIAATYYFRAEAESWDEVTIREIALLGMRLGITTKTWNRLREIRGLKTPRLNTLEGNPVQLDSEVGGKGSQRL